MIDTCAGIGWDSSPIQVTCIDPSSFTHVRHHFNLAPARIAVTLTTQLADLGAVPERADDTMVCPWPAADIQNVIGRNARDFGDIATAAWGS